VKFPRCALDALQSELIAVVWQASDSDEL